MCTIMEKPPCASSAPSPAPRTYAAIVNAWISTPIDRDRAPGEHQPQRCSSHARDHTTPLGRSRRRAYGAGMTNRLADASSPYLLQHAENPVDWNPWGEEAFAARESGRPAAPRLGRLQLLPLVPRDGARVVLRSGNGSGDERALRQRQGRPRRAAGRRRHHDGRLRDDDRAGRVADDRVPDARGQPVLRRHVLPARAATRDAELRAAPAGDRGGMARAPRRPGDAGRAARRRARRHVAARRRRRRAHTPRCSTRPSAASPATTSRPSAASARPRSSRPRRRSSSSCDAAAPRRSGWSGARSTGWPQAASTTSSAAASTATRSTHAGSCRTSRRCSTTTRSSSRRTSTPGS